MAYRIDFNFKAGPLEALNQFKGAVPQLAQAIVKDSADLLAEYGKQNLSGVPFTSSTGTHTIQKRSGRGAASVTAQYPYGSPYRARVFASALTRYANNPEEWDYLAILEYGRGEIRPKYTPAAARGDFARARLAIPGGPHQLVNGQGGFRGMSGRYSFMKSIPPMEGKFWMAAAATAAGPDLEQNANDRTDEALKQYGLM
jgi:hypothetical protein